MLELLRRAHLGGGDDRQTSPNLENAFVADLSDTDKLAEYGLTALVVGGAGAALLKSGLLAKLWEPLVATLAALGVGIKRLFFGGRSAEHDPEKPIV